MITTVLLGVGLSMDCAAVLLSLHTVDHNRKSLIHYVLPVIFAVAHTIMPVIGWGIGFGFRRVISQYDHWIAFILLVGLGSKMIYSAIKGTDKSVKIEKTTSLRSLLLLAFATSLDSVAVGMTFAFLNQPVVISALIIGATTLAISLTADIVGDHIGHLFKNSKQDIIGGLVLVSIGIKILLEHLFF